jgi:hypothetical protein
MKKKLLCITLLISLSAMSQEYEWQWAKRGGGIAGSQGETTSAYRFDSEQIKDIVVDADNNYYYLAFMTEQETEYEGTDVTVYNAPNSSSGGTDVVLISTTCEGVLRWTQTIGGAAPDYSYKLGLDNNGGLYLGANVLNITEGSPNTYEPTHFSPDNMLPQIEDNPGVQEAYKTVALLKYNTSNGTLAWRVMPQGDVNLSLRYGSINQIVVQPDGTIHTLIGFLAGTHLNGQIVVPETYVSSYKYYIIKFNAQGTVLSTLPLSFEGVLLEPHTEFRYDQSLNRYYVAGFRNYYGGGQLLPLSFNNTPFQKTMYILAIDSQGNQIWRKEENNSGNVNAAELRGMHVDKDSNIYICGNYFRNDDAVVTFSNYTFPSTVAGNIVYVMKLDSNGNVLWGTTPAFESTANMAFDLVVHKDEVAVATEMHDGTWGNATLVREPNHLTDPVVVRFNKNTGAAIKIHDIYGPAGYKDALTAIAVDNDGNYITGGYFRYQLFTKEEDDVATLSKVGGQTAYTDFFIAKLANAACGSGTQGGVEFNKTKLKIYPNPSSGQIYFESEEELSSYEVINILGQRLLSGNLRSSQNSISIENLSTGSYMINIKTMDGKTFNQKIIRE